MIQKDQSALGKLERLRRGKERGRGSRRGCKRVDLPGSGEEIEGENSEKRLKGEKATLV